MQAAQTLDTISVEDYLEGEKISDVKHELIAGEVYAMSGVSKNHERIFRNLYLNIGNHLATSSCDIYSSDMKVRVANNFFYPDLMVVCDETTDHDYYTDTPIIIVEILSPSTRRRDRTLKREQYLTLPSLQEYVLIEQDSVDIEVIRRNNHWQSSHYFMGDQVTFDSIGLSLPVETIYQRVQNTDVAEYARLQ